MVVFGRSVAATECIQKQLGRRNLSDENRTYIIGKMYEARKKARGGDMGNQYTKVARRQNDAMPKPERTRKTIAKELGIGVKSVERAGDFSKGIDAIREMSPELPRRSLVQSQLAVDVLVNIVLMLCHALEDGRTLMRKTHFGQHLLFGWFCTTVARPFSSELVSFVRLRQRRRPLT